MSKSYSKSAIIIKSLAWNRTKEVPREQLCFYSSRHSPAPSHAIAWLSAAYQSGHWYHLWRRSGWQLHYAGNRRVWGLPAYSRSYILSDPFSDCPNWSHRQGKRLSLFYGSCGNVLQDSVAALLYAYLNEVIDFPIDGLGIIIIGIMRSIRNHDQWNLCGIMPFSTIFFDFTGVVVFTNQNECRTLYDKIAVFFQKAGISHP